MNPKGDVRLPNVLHKLIFRKEIPVMSAVFISLEKLPNQPSEYNTPDGTYGKVIVNELMRVITRQYNITRNPGHARDFEGHLQLPYAFSVARERPDQFRTVITIVGSVMNPHGAQVRGSAEHRGDGWLGEQTLRSLKQLGKMKFESP